MHVTYQLWKKKTKQKQKIKTQKNFKKIRVIHKKLWKVI